MPEMHQKKEHYYAVFYDPTRRPTRKWVALKTKNKQVAKLRMSEYERDYALGTYDPWADKPRNTKAPLAEAIQSFLDAPEGRRTKTIQGYRDILFRFVIGLPSGILLSQVQGSDILRFIERPSLSDASKASYYRHLKAFFGWCMGKGLIAQSPVQGVARPKVGRKEAAFLSAEEASELVTLMRRHNAAWLSDVVLFALNTGLRLGEITNLKWKAVDLAHGYIRVLNDEDFKTKSGHERRVPLVGDAKAVVEHRLASRASGSEYVFTGVEGGPLYDHYVSRRFREMRVRAGLPAEIHFHSLRHTCASWLVMRGVSIMIVQQVLGHSSVTVTQRYAHLSPDAVSQAMLYAFGGGSKNVKT